MNLRNPFMGLLMAVLLIWTVTACLTTEPTTKPAVVSTVPTPVATATPSPTVATPTDDRAVREARGLKVIYVTDHMKLYGTPRRRVGEYRVVFSTSTETITIENKTTGDGFMDGLAFWVRPKGTTQRSQVRTFSCNTDGIATFGINGKGDPEGDKKLWNEPEHQDGLENLPFWQGNVESALAHAERHFYGKQKVSSSVKKAKLLPCVTTHFDLGTGKATNVPCKPKSKG